MHITCFDEDDILVIRLSDKPIVSEVSQNWNTHISYAEDDSTVEVVLLEAGAEALRYLMQRDNLRQVDLPELGSQGVVSELLSGRLGFNVRQTKALAERSGVSAALFL